MWDSLAKIAISGGPVGLVALCVVSIIRGWLIPRRVHLDRVGDLKAANEALERANAEKDRQIATLLGRAREPLG